MTYVQMRRTGVILPSDVARARRRRRRARIGFGDGIASQAIAAVAAGAELPAFTQNVEDWRDLVTQQALDLPVEFLLAWIAQESQGFPCDYTKYAEAGIFQLMPPDNLTVAGTTMAQIHPVPPCTAGVSTHSQTFASLTDAQTNEQVRSGLQYVNVCRGQAHEVLDANGITWDETTASFWSVVKMFHIAPSTVAGLFSSAVTQLGGPPADFDAFRATVTSWPANWLDNAEGVGLYGAGGGLSASDIAKKLTNPSNLVIVGALGLAAYLMWKMT